ncbi:hypothetical protein M407DRAFT_17670 [Tulasnella calospora MUT 4182]|uniref:Uncharacterized protein n=1 Tax=Tulasnella calospora MUT 4182 TaxID=1051891 RepID=A0A0C3MIB3_9AGAM|nr:hypothetical protein M407DRAFT_17670 [Tulasnella calospora MUT 4182]
MPARNCTEHFCFTSSRNVSGRTRAALEHWDLGQSVGKWGTRDGAPPPWRINTPHCLSGSFILGSDKFLQISNEKQRENGAFSEKRLVNSSLLPCAMYRSSPTATVLAFFELGPQPEFNPEKIPLSLYFHRSERVSSPLLLFGRVLGFAVAIVGRFASSGVPVASFAATTASPSLFLTLALALALDEALARITVLRGGLRYSGRLDVVAPVSRPVEVEPAAFSADDGIDDSR